MSQTLLDSIAKSLRAGETVILLDQPFRWCSPGEIIDDPESTCEYHVLSYGVYTRYNVYRNNVLVDFRWLKYCDHIEELSAILYSMTEREQETLKVSLAFTRAMKGMRNTPMHSHLGSR